MNKMIRPVIVTAAVIIAMIIVNVICNIAGHELDSYYVGIIVPICVMLFYEWSEERNRKKNSSMS